MKHGYLTILCVDHEEGQHARGRYYIFLLLLPVNKLDGFWGNCDI